jgi:hypothetical protein
VEAGAPATPGDTTGLEPVDPPLTLLAQPRIIGQLLASSRDGPATALQVRPFQDPAVPDLLAYWARSAPNDGASLPPDATLLAALRGSRTQIVTLPEPGRPPGGIIILYSQGWHRVMAVVPLSHAP